jgi:hypothetical protein
VKARLNTALPAATPLSAMAAALPPALFGEEGIRQSDDLLALLA